MSRPNTPTDQLSKTKDILRDLRQHLNLSWKELFVLLDVNFPGVISGESHLRLLGTGRRGLSDDSLSRIAKFAMRRGLVSDLILSVSTYVPPSLEDRTEESRSQRHERYLMSDPEYLLYELPSKLLLQAERSALDNFTTAMNSLSSLGFSHAEILYMAHAWLRNTPPTSRRGKRQRRFVKYRSAESSLLDRYFLPESLPIHDTGDVDEFPRSMSIAIESPVDSVSSRIGALAPNGALDDKSS